MNKCFAVAVLIWEEEGSEEWNREKEELEEEDGEEPSTQVRNVGHGRPSVETHLGVRQIQRGSLSCILILNLMYNIDPKIWKLV